jgi:hypothetical protein
VLDCVALTFSPPATRPRGWCGSRSGGSGKSSFYFKGVGSPLERVLRTSGCVAEVQKLDQRLLEQWLDREKLCERYPRHLNTDQNKHAVVASVLRVVLYNAELWYSLIGQHLHDLTQITKLRFYIINKKYVFRCDLYTSWGFTVSSLYSTLFNYGI